MVDDVLRPLEVAQHPNRMNNELLKVRFELFTRLPDVVRIQEPFGLAPVLADLRERHVVRICIECRVDDRDCPRSNFCWGTLSLLDKRRRARLNIVVCEDVQAPGNIDCLVDTTVRKGDGRSRDCVEARGEVELVENVDYRARCAVSEE